MCYCQHAEFLCCDKNVVKFGLWESLQAEMVSAMEGGVGTTFY